MGSRCSEGPRLVTGENRAKRSLITSVARLDGSARFFDGMRGGLPGSRAALRMSE